MFRRHPTSTRPPHAVSAPAGPPSAVRICRRIFVDETRVAGDSRSSAHNKCGYARKCRSGEHFVDFKQLPADYGQYSQQNDIDAAGMPPDFVAAMQLTLITTILHTLSHCRRHGKYSRAHGAISPEWKDARDERITANRVSDGAATVTRSLSLMVAIRSIMPQMKCCRRQAPHMSVLRFAIGQTAVAVDRDRRE